jgi:hypothetical protein
VTIQTLLKAKTIFKAGGVNQVHFHTFAVTSTSGEQYVVNVKKDRCSCPSTTTCSHMSAVNIHRSHRRRIA